MRISKEEKERMLAKYSALMEAQVKHYDREEAHMQADKLLCLLLTELGFKEVVDLWEEVPKWYS